MILFRVSSFGDTSIDALKEAVPGIICYGKVNATVKSPDNAAWLVDNALRAAEAKYDVTAQPIKNTAVEVEFPPLELRDGIYEKFFMPHQRAGVEFALTKSGSLFLHAPGAGKTLPALAWALCCAESNSRTLWVTRAITKSPHLDQVHRYTTVDGQILEGESPTVLVIKAYRKASTRRLAHGATWSLSSGGAVVTGGTFPDLSCERDLNTTEIAAGVYELSVTLPDVWTLVQTVSIQHSQRVNCVADFESKQIVFSTESHIDTAKRFTIINWEILPGWADLLCASKFSNVVFDEIHRSGGAKRHIAIHNDTGKKPKFVPRDNIAYASMRVSRAIPRRLGLTGTLVRDKPANVWAPLDLICPKEFGGRAQFMGRYANRHTGTFGEVNDSGASNLDELQKRMSFVVHRVSKSESHKHLPPLRRETVYIPASQLVDVADTKEVTRLAGNSLLEYRIFQAASRKRKYVIEAALECIENQQHCVIFTGRRADCEDIYKKLASAAKGRGKAAKEKALILMAHGGVPVEIREATRLAYMNCTTPAVLVATGDSMGEGVDLQNTDVALIAQLPYTPAALDQWESRFFRLGGALSPIIKYLIATGTVDEHIASMLLTKLPNVEKLQRGGDTEGMTRALMGGKSDSEIQSDLVSLLLGGTSDLEDTI